MYRGCCSRCAQRTCASTPGQISFPGGSLESSDADPLATALREAYEEVGIEPAFIEPLGFLCDHVVMTGFRITPIVALLHPGYTLRINESEVAEVFDLPLEALLDPLSYHKTIRHLRGTDVELIEIRHEGRVIWGATAGILQSVCEILRGPDAMSMRPAQLDQLLGADAPAARSAERLCLGPRPGFRHHCALYDRGGL